MTDVFSKSKRSEVMRAIRSTDTKPEVTVRRILKQMGLRSAHLGGQLPGKPDVVLKQKKIVIFVHGCFWHNHANCKISRIPGSNRPFWISKFASNKRRDRRVKTALVKLGWRVHVIWECQTRKRASESKLVEKLVRMVRGRPARAKSRARSRLIQPTGGPR